MRPLSIALLAALAACAARPTLAPAPTAQPAPDMPGGAYATVNGVELQVWPERWDADPRTLPDHVTPVLVRLENKGEHEVLVRFDHFEMVDGAGGDFSAMPPFALDETVTEPITITRMPISGFRIAPHLRAYYPSFPVFTRDFLVNRSLYTRHLTAWREIPLPTADMVQLALPEGVLEPGGVATGFVYFERVSGRQPRITLDYRLVTTDGVEVGRATSFRRAAP